MNENWSEFKEIIKLMKNNMGRFIKYQIASKLLLGLILLPIMRGIFSLAMKSRGFSYITNGLLKKFLISPQGIVCVGISMLLAVIIILIEVGGMIVLCQQGIQKSKEQSCFAVFRYCLSKLKYLAGIDGLLILIYLIIIAPFMNADITSSLLKNLKIPGYIMDTVYSTTSYSVFLLILMVIMVVIFVRWMFAMQFMMLTENNKRPFKRSGKLVSKNFKRIIKYSLGMMVYSLIMAIVVAIIFVCVAIGIVSFADQENAEIIILAIINFGIVIVFIGSFFVIPFETLKTTKLFNRICEEPIRNDFGKVKNKKNFVDKFMGNKLIMVPIIIVGLILASIISYFTFESMEDIKYAVDITAHRGSSKDAPENTLIALKTAVKNGATYAEIDVQETKDGHLILLHDKSVKRTTGVEKNIWELTLEEVRELDAGSWFNEKFKGEKIPTLEEVIEYSKGKIKLNIEIKRNGHEKSLIKSTVEMVKAKNFINDCVITSLDYEVLSQVEKIEPRIKTGYIMFVAIGDLEKLNIDFYSVEETNVNESFVEKAHKINRQVHVWTINDVDSLERLLDLGVDNIITDNDREFSEFLKEKKESN